jgi:hypothetical protein
MSDASETRRYLDKVNRRREVAARLFAELFYKRVLVERKKKPKHVQDGKLDRNAK